MEHVLVFSRQTAEKASPQAPHAWISITDPGSSQAELQESPHLHSILRLEFHDLDLLEEGGGGLVLPNEHHARQILHFVQKYAEEIELLYVHCEAGISRSAGVAAAISKIWFNDDNEFFAGIFYPNRRIYSLILNEHYSQE